MKARLMKTQREEILARLAHHGWRARPCEDEGLEWWADEMWLLESTWSPVGSRAYVTFLVDPQFEGVRKQGEAVWAVMASPGKPGGRLHVEREFTLSLGQGWKKRLPEFFAHLAALRGQAGQAGGA